MLIQTARMKRVQVVLFALFFGLLASSSAGGLLTSQLAISGVTEDHNMQVLTIHGYNFDNAVTEVYYDEGSLYIMKQDPTEVYVSFPGLPTASGTFSLTVKRGDAYGEYDTFKLVLGDGEPDFTSGRLAIDVAVLAYDPDIDTSYIYISGTNFYSGSWEPEVTVGDMAFTVDQDNSGLNQLIAERAGVSFEVEEHVVPVTVKTGPEVADYDVWVEPYQPEATPGSFGSFWKECPNGWKEGKDRKKGPYPLCFQITEDMDFDLTTPYVPDVNPNLLLPFVPDPRFGGALISPIYAYSRSKQRKIRDWILDGLLPGGITIDLDGESEKKYYLLEPEGMLRLIKGYRWDGPTPPGKMSKPHDYKTVVMRSSMVHDAIYDLMRMGRIPRDTRLLSSFGAGFQNQRVADNAFYSICFSDDPSQVARCLGWWVGIRLGGAYNTHHDLAEWKTHALADAGEDATYECTPPEGQEVTLDGSASRYAESWEWTWGVGGEAEGEVVEQFFGPGTHEVLLTVDFGEDKHDYSLDTDQTSVTVVPDIVPPSIEVEGELTVENEPGQCGARVYFTAIAYDHCGVEQIECTHQSGDLFPVGETAVTCTATDLVGNTGTARFMVTVEDVEPPVIIGTSEPLMAWSTNHKYRQFSAWDFILSVTDNCTPLDLEDLTIVQATSDESDNTKSGGDGNTTDDILIAQDGKSVGLRMERQGKGAGRIYTIYFEATDDYSNSTTEPFWVLIPHSREMKDK